MSFFDYHLPYFIVLGLAILAFIRVEKPPFGFWQVPENFLIFVVFGLVLAVPYLFIYLIASVVSAFL